MAESSNVGILALVWLLASPLLGVGLVPLPLALLLAPGGFCKDKDGIFLLLGSSLARVDELLCYSIGARSTGSFPPSLFAVTSS